MPVDSIVVEDVSREFVLRPPLLSRLRKKKSIRHVHALRGVSLRVHEGELFGLLGPNGAGKTTLIKILCTLLLPTSGKASVGGHDVVAEAERVKEMINMVSGGESSGYGILTVRENIWMFSQLYGVPTKEALKRIDDLLAVVGLEERADMRAHKLSTGEKQKMGICRGFVTDPKVMFLDEPTLGLDVTAARTIRGFIRRWVSEDHSRTVMLTTHYMAEADELCDRIAIINDGGIIACGTPEELKRLVAKECVFLLKTEHVKDMSVLASVGGIKGLTHTESIHDSTTSLRMILEDEGVLGDVISILSRQGIRLLHLQKMEPTLEDVFLHLCGRGLEDGSPADARTPGGVQE